jgi:hypothetical protein
MIRSLLTSVVFLGVVCVGAALVGDGAAQDGESTAAKVTAQRGTTEALLLDTEDWVDTKIGRVYTTGTELKTGTRSYIEVALDENNSFRIKGTTQVKVEKIMAASEDEAGKVIRLVELQVIDGEVNARLNDLPEDVRVNVASPTAVAGASGTGFTVSVDALKKLSKVKVVDGGVLVQALDSADKKVEVDAFQQVDVTPWEGGTIQATGHGVLSEKVLGKAFVDKFRQQPEAITVTAAATAQAPEELRNTPERRAAAEEEATDQARSNMSALVLGLVVNELTTVADLLAADETLATKVYAAIAELKPAETEFGDDDSCTVTLVLDLKAIDETLGKAVAGTIASVEELAREDYLAKFGPQAAITTKRAAEVDAQRRLAEKIYGSVIEGGQVLNDVATAPVRVTIQGVVRGAVVTETHYFSDGSVTVVMTCQGDAIAEQHGDIVGDTFLSSPEPAVISDFMDYRAMHTGQ